MTTRTTTPPLLQDRRRFLAFFAATSVSTTLFPGVLWAKVMAAPARRVTREMIAEAEGIAGIDFTEEERDLMLGGLNDHIRSFQAIRRLEIPNEVPPALHFDPFPPGVLPPPRVERKPVVVGKTGDGDTVTSDLEDLAFASVARLSRLVQSRKVSSVDLTKMYLARLERHDGKLLCVTHLTEKRALAQAEKADGEIRSGNIRGPLHGIPWGAKDLLAVKGYPTTWGAEPYKDQMIDSDAAVVRRLDEAGAVLVAKLTLGALAWGDVWYGGMTRNPWNTEQGSSGSSAGPASATAAGLVGFAIGSETWGSIVSPSTRCGVTGHRPTYGLVSREGAMALSWSMDKLGPIARTVEDCALVLHAISGRNEKDRDPSTRDTAFNWNGNDRDVKKLRIAYVKSAFESRQGPEGWKKNDEAVLEELRKLGATLVPVDLPDLPVEALSFILNAEAAAAFDELTRSDRDDLLVRQERMAWPNVFRQSRFIPAVEYLQANRARTLLLEAMDRIFRDIDVYVCPSYGGNNLLLTNLTGHPSTCVPDGFLEDGSPTSITFVGRLFGDGEVLRVARGFQESTSHHLRHPDLGSG
jgi:Asp-tRNA(Asn)/Glu-tRNA(Gln) amidotransferase A subunit family amidase